MAGKTGTTQNWSDAWTVGFSPYMTTAVWLGFDRGGSNSLGTNQTGAMTAGPIWAWYMKEVHRDLPTRQFERPNGLVDVTVTARTGKLPTENYRGATIEEVFIAGTEPKEFDTSESFHAERRDRVVSQLTRPTSVLPAAALRDTIFSPVQFDTTTDEDESSTPSFDSGVNPFFDDSPSSRRTPDPRPSDEPAPEPAPTQGLQWPFRSRPFAPLPQPAPDRDTESNEASGAGGGDQASEPSDGGGSSEEPARNRLFD